jgi:hypothetical protein
MLVPQAMLVETAGMVAGSPASITTSRAMLLQSREGTTLPQITRSGAAPPSWSTIWRATGTDSAIASNLAKAPSTFAKGVRTPEINQMPFLADISTETLSS